MRPHKKVDLDSFDFLLKHLFSKALKKHNEAQKRFEGLRKKIERKHRLLKLPENISL